MSQKTLNLVLTSWVLLSRWRCSTSCSSLFCSWEISRSCFSSWLVRRWRVSVSDLSRVACRGYEGKLCIKHCTSWVQDHKMRTTCTWIVWRLDSSKVWLCCWLRIVSFSWFNLDSTSFSMCISLRRLSTWPLINGDWHLLSTHIHKCQ